MAHRGGIPKQILSVMDGIALIIGIVVGVGIFKTPSLVAASTGKELIFLLTWIAGGVISIVGALCYAELATTYPSSGGDYHYLYRAYGRKVAFLFAWARMAVIQPGSIAMLGFVLGDYLAQLLPFNGYGPSFYALCAVGGLTGLNLLGTRRGTRTQNLLTALTMAGLLSVVVAGAAFSPLPVHTAPPDSPSEATFGLAMIFVLLTFGGWNEAVYISAELPEIRRNMVRVLLGGVGIIMLMYLLISMAYLRGLGLAEMSRSEVVAADLMRKAVGESGAKFISFLIALSALGSINAAIITGARTNYALGMDFSSFGFLGKWDEEANTPRHALLLQGSVTFALVLLGTLTRKGFVTMVDYTAPVFWAFFFLTGLSLLILRSKNSTTARPFKVPLYPITPLFFCGTCLYMLRSSLIYTGIGALLGVAVLMGGTVILLFLPPAGDKKRGEGLDDFT